MAKISFDDDTRRYPPRRKRQPPPPGQDYDMLVALYGRPRGYFELERPARPKPKPQDPTP